MATLSTAGFAVFARTIADDRRQSHVLITAGRLATSVQRIRALERALETPTALADRLAAQRALAGAAADAEAALTTLHDPRANPAGWPPPAARVLIDEPPASVTAQVGRLVRDARTAASAPPTRALAVDRYSRADDERLTAVLGQLPEVYLADARARHRRLFALGALTLAILLLALVAEVAFIGRPMARAIARRESELLERMREHEATIAELRRSEATLERAQRAARVGSIQRDLRTGEVLVSQELFRIGGLDPATTTPSVDLLWRFIHPDDIDLVRDATRRAQSSGESFAIDCRLLLDDGTLRWISHSGFYERDADGTPILYYGTSVDITDRKLAEERLSHEAMHDSLTGLGNRALLLEALETAVAVARRSGTFPAIVFIDLDHFKPINDMLGHVVGDRVLVEVAARLQRVSLGAAAIARAGGDEFVIVIADRRSVGDLGRFAARVGAALAAPHHIDGRELMCPASIGISCYGNDGDDAQTLLRHADTAMYAAKAAGGNEFRFFTGSMNAQSNERLWLEADLHSGIERGQFELYYQPIVSAATGVMSGVEALVRWIHPTLGIIGPDRFMPIAEANGTIVPLGEWVLRTACAQARRWRNERWPYITLSVNLSARQLRYDRLAESVAAILDESRLDAHALEFELTESAVISDIDAAVATMGALRDLGVRIAVDDFGTGYASMAYLKRLPVDTVKIDRMFVRDLPEDRGDIAIVRAVTLMAHELGLDVTAEGVEEAQQADFLSGLGCDSLQGYFFCRPMPAGELEARCGDGQAVAGFTGSPLERDAVSVLP